MEQPTELQLEEVRVKNGCATTPMTTWQESDMGMMDGDVAASTVTLAPWLKGSVQESVKRLMMR